MSERYFYETFPCFDNRFICGFDVIRAKRENNRRNKENGQAVTGRILFQPRFEGL